MSALFGAGVAVVALVLGRSEVRVSGVFLWIMGVAGVLLMFIGAVGFIVSWRGSDTRQLSPNSHGHARPDDSLRGALQSALREGNALAGEANGLEPIGNLELLDDLVCRYNGYERRVADLLAATDLLDRRWRVEWLRDPEWHDSRVYPITREQLDRMAQMIGHRVRLIDRMLRELEERRP